MRYEHIWTACHAQAWAILPEKLAEIEHFLEVKATGGNITAEDIQAIRIRSGGDGGGIARVGSVGILPVRGTITFRSSMLNEASGGTSTQALSASLREAMDDPQIKTIMLDVNSPGGTVPGVDEFASELRVARESKRVIAQIAPLAASAAFWIASQASEIVAMPSADVGSIGVFAMHQDRSAMMERLGVKTSLISAGRFKTEANPFEPLSDEARADIQISVNEAFDSFVKSVALGRQTTVANVRKNFGEGRLVSAKRAKAAGMIDRIGTLGETLARANGARSGRRAEDIHSVRDFEDHLRDVGFSANAARNIASSGFKHEASLDSRDETEWADVGQSFERMAFEAELRQILRTGGNPNGN